MFSSIADEQGLGRRHLQKPSQPTLECDFARGAAFMRFPAAQPGQQLPCLPRLTSMGVSTRARGRRWAVAGAILPWCHSPRRS